MKGLVRKNEEIKTMAEAVGNHRASKGSEPRSVYGKIVSFADRNTLTDDILNILTG